MSSTRLVRVLTVVAALAIITITGAGAVLGAGPARASVATTNNVVKPKISGVPVVGSALAVSTGGWVGAPPLFYSYQWRSPKNSDLGTKRHYTPTASDVGQILTVRVTVQDGNNSSAHIDVSTKAAVIQSNVVDKVPPRFTGGLAVGDIAMVSTGTFTSGSGALTYSYAWSSTNGQASTALADKGATHLITKADLGLYLSVVVTAKSPTQFGTVSVQSPTLVAPTAPFASDSSLTTANSGGITAKTTGDSSTISDPSGTAGAAIYVYAYSSPTGVGWYALTAGKSAVVSIAKLSHGPHKLVVLNQSGAFVGWVAVTRAAAATTGVKFNSPVAVIAIGVLAAGILIIVIGAVTRRRRA